MTRDDAIRAEMRDVYGKMCTEVLKLDAAKKEGGRLEGALTEAQGREVAGRAAMKGALGAAAVNLRGYRELRAALQGASADVATAEGHRDGKAAEVQRIESRYSELQGRYHELQKELESMGATVIEFKGQAE